VEFPDGSSFQYWAPFFFFCFEVTTLTMSMHNKQLAGSASSMSFGTPKVPPPCGMQTPNTPSTPTTRDSDQRDAVHVSVRVRPESKQEQAKGLVPFLRVEQETCSVVVQEPSAKRFTFDGVQGEESSQQETFELVGRSVGERCFEGYNGSICVYGQTGSGKTYTMFGLANSARSMQQDERRGLAWRVLEYVFNEMDLRAMDGTSFTCRCSFLEIYREQITDLLDPSKLGLQVREDTQRGIYVDRLSEPKVDTLEEAFQVLQKGLLQRRTGATHMNERSSRSHAMLAISIEMHRACEVGATAKQVVRLNLVDLAGSERQQGVQDPVRHSSQHRNPLPVKEAGAINKSLSALTNVIIALSQDERKWRRQTAGGPCQRHFVNYRDSKLTLLLRDSLGGRSRTAVVANVSPSAVCSMETVSTLKFAARAKRIRCNALQKEADVSYSAAAMENMVREVVMLRKRVAELESVACNCSLVRMEDSTNTKSFCGQSTASISTGDGTLSGSDFSPSCISRGMEETSDENDEDVQACMDATKRELVEAIGKLAEVEARLHVAALDTKDAASLVAGGTAVRARPTSPSIAGSATFCEHFNGVSRQVLHRSSHAVSTCQLTPVFLPQSPTLVSGCCSPLLVSRQVRVNTHAPCVASTWRLSPRAQSQPRHRSLSPARFVFLEAPAPQLSMHGRPRPRAFSPHAATPTQWSWGAVNSTQRWAHI